MKYVTLFSINTVVDTLYSKRNGFKIMYFWPKFKIGFSMQCNDKISSFFIKMHIGWNIDFIAPQPRNVDRPFIHKKLKT